MRAMLDTSKCIWEGLFDSDERKSLEKGLFYTGIVSIILGLWMGMSISLTKLGVDRSYRHLAKFSLLACVRRMIPLIAQLPFLDFESFNQSNPYRRETLAFFETFFAVFEVEWLAHVCIERYILAKYATHGWPIDRDHYTLFQCLSLLCAALYSAPPFIDIGRYSFDFSCSFYTYDVFLPGTFTKYAVVSIFVLRSIKPAMVMILMLVMTRRLENKIGFSETTPNQVGFSKKAIIVTLVNQFCWCPIAFIRGGVLVTQLMYLYPTVPATAFYIKLAMWLHWMSPALTVAVLFVIDSRIRNEMLRLSSRKEAEEEKDE